MLCLCLLIASHLSWLGISAAQTTVETYAGHAHDACINIQHAGLCQAESSGLSGEGGEKGVVEGGGVVTRCYNAIAQEA